MAKGSWKNLTAEQKNIFRSIISGPKTFYDLTSFKKGACVAAKDTVIKFFKRARAMNYIEVKKKGFSLSRGKKPRGLTLLGLIYCIRINLLEPKKAYDIRLKHKLKFPKMKDPLLIPLVLEDGKEITVPLDCFFIEDIEKNNTEEFYKFLAYQRNFPTEDMIPLLFTLAGFFLFFRAYGRKDKFLEKYIKGDDILLPNGLRIENFRRFHRDFQRNLKTVLKRAGL